MLLGQRLGRCASSLIALIPLVTTPRADGLDGALDWLDFVGMPVPPGCNVKYGPVEGPAFAETSLSGGCTITIDLDALTAYVRKFGDGFGGNPADMPLVLAVVLMHELFHHPFYGAWSDSTCHEIALAQMVADALSSLIDLVASEGGM